MMPRDHCTDAQFLAT